MLKLDNSCSDEKNIGSGRNVAATEIAENYLDNIEDQPPGLANGQDF